MTVVQNFPIVLSRKEILSYLGFKPRKSQISAQSDKTIDAMMSGAGAFFSPIGAFETLQVESISQDRIAFAGTHFAIQSEHMAKYLSACARVTVIAVTVGAGIETEIDRLFACGCSSEAVVLDAVGSDAAEQAMDWVNAHIREMAAEKGWKTLRRVSPGYSIWGIDANASISELLDFRSIGIEVLPGFGLCPRKSVTAAVGWTAG